VEHFVDFGTTATTDAVVRLEPTADASEILAPQLSECTIGGSVNRGDITAGEPEQSSVIMP
jgi:hypothetical protein